MRVEGALAGVLAIGFILVGGVVAGFSALTVGLAIDTQERGPTVPPELEAFYRQGGHDRGVDWALLAAWDGASNGFELPVSSRETIFASLVDQELATMRELAELRCRQSPGDPDFCPPPPPVLSPEQRDQLYSEADRQWRGQVVSHVGGHAEQALAVAGDPWRVFSLVLAPEEAGRAAELYEGYLLLDLLDQHDDHVSEVVDAGPPADWHPVDGFAWPAVGPITSRYGMRVSPIDGRRRLHAGIDMGLDSGTPVRASKAGVVIRAEWDDVYGFVVVVDHGDGYRSLYAHNSTLLVRVGSQVSQGQAVSLSGSTGWSTGPHLHFEIHYQGSPVDLLLLVGRTS